MDDLAPLHTKNTDTASWALCYNSRNSNALKRQEVLDLVVSLIGTHYTVNLKSPQRLVVVQVVKVNLLHCHLLVYVQAFCGLSIITQYSRIAHYNLNISKSTIAE